MEILVVLVILGMLFGLVGPRVIDYLSRAKTDVSRMQLENLATALDLYRLDVGRYPSQAEGLRALVTTPTGINRWNGPYLKDKAVPLDPWDREYIYVVPGVHGGGVGVPRFKRKDMLKTPEGPDFFVENPAVARPDDVDRGEPHLAR